MTTNGTRFKDGDVVICIQRPESNSNINVGDRAWVTLNTNPKMQSKFILDLGTLSYCYWAQHDHCYKEDDMTILATYPSKSTPGKHHEVREGEDGVIYCTCWAWRKNRTCRHLEDYNINGAKQSMPIASQKNSLDEIINKVVQELTA